MYTITIFGSSYQARCLWAVAPARVMLSLSKIFFVLGKNINKLIKKSFLHHKIPWETPVHSAETANVMAGFEKNVCASMQKKNKNLHHCVCTLHLAAEKDS